MIHPIFDFQMIQDGLTTVENEIRNVMEREIVEIVENKENEWSDLYE